MNFYILVDMAWKAPTKHLKTKELLDEERFYQLLSAQWNYFDHDTVFLCYMGLVKLIGEELRKHKFVRLPHLGDMAMVQQKERPAWVGRHLVRIGPKDVLKFYPKEYMRRNLNKRKGVEIRSLISSK